MHELEYRADMMSFMENKELGPLHLMPRLKGRSDVFVSQESDVVPPLPRPFAGHVSEPSGESSGRNRTFFVAVIHFTYARIDLTFDR